MASRLKVKSTIQEARPLLLSSAFLMAFHSAAFVMAMKSAKTWIQCCKNSENSQLLNALVEEEEASARQIVAVVDHRGHVFSIGRQLADLEPDEHVVLGVNVRSTGRGQYAAEFRRAYRLADWNRRRQHSFRRLSYAAKSKLVVTKVQSCIHPVAQVISTSSSLYFKNKIGFARAHHRYISLSYFNFKSK